jgi:hypothetical protein
MGRIHPFYSTKGPLSEANYSNHQALQYSGVNRRKVDK